MVNTALVAFPKESAMCKVDVEAGEAYRDVALPLIIATVPRAQLVLKVSPLTRLTAVPITFTMAVTGKSAKGNGWYVSVSRGGFIKTAAES
jgi:hypothetical protein